MTIVPLRAPARVSLPRHGVGWALMPAQLAAVAAAAAWPLGVLPALMVAVLVAGLYLFARHRFWASR